LFMFQAFVVFKGINENKILLMSLYQRRKVPQ
jgi:hypothetical protein